MVSSANDRPVLTQPATAADTAFVRRLLLLPLLLPLLLVTLGAAAPAPVRWEWNGRAWQALGGKPPACPRPVRLSLPVEPAKVTAVLYPGQVRGGNYKAHGGFRLDGQPPAGIVVKAPVTGIAVRGARYVEAGELQHLVDLQMPCGILVRLDHLRAPTGALGAAFAKLAKATDTRTTNFNPPVPVTAGSTVATGAGFVAMNNPSLDLGVYDLRARNARSKDPAWAARHDPAMAAHAVCWLDLVADGPRLRALPAGDQAAGRASDFCR
jgi:hypothetical protein